jgi:hypothetical protein
MSLLRLIGMTRDLVAEFDATDGAWWMEFDDCYYAYYEDEFPLGPFPTLVELAEAAERAGWIKPENTS